MYKKQILSPTSMGHMSAVNNSYTPNRAVCTQISAREQHRIKQTNQTEAKAKLFANNNSKIQILRNESQTSRHLCSPFD